MLQAMKGGVLMDAHKGRWVKLNNKEINLKIFVP
jgi:hypothetical protein